MNVDLNKFINQDQRLAMFIQLNDLFIRSFLDGSGRNHSCRTNTVSIFIEDSQTQSSRRTINPSARSRRRSYRYNWQHWIPRLWRFLLVLAKKVTFYRSSTASVVGAGIAVSTVVVGETVTWRSVFYKPCGRQRVSFTLAI